MITVEELNKMLADNILEEHHTAFFRGYVSRKNPPQAAWEYEGKFGKGYTLKKPCSVSSTYSYITYYTYKEV